MSDNLARSFRDCLASDIAFDRCDTDIANTSDAATGSTRSSPNRFPEKESTFRPLGLIAYRSTIASHGHNRLASVPPVDARDSDIHINIEAGPYTLRYGYEFVDAAALNFLTTPQTARYVLHILACFAACTSGMLGGKHGSGRTWMLRSAAAACGRMCRVVDCFDGVDTAGLTQVVTGSGLMGSWLAVKGLSALSLQELSALAGSMVRVLEEHRRVLSEGFAVAAHKIPAMFLIGSSNEFHWRRQIPADLREAARTCSIAEGSETSRFSHTSAAHRDGGGSHYAAAPAERSMSAARPVSTSAAFGFPERRVMCEILMCAEGLAGWRAAAAELDRALCMLQIGVLRHELWCVGVRGLKAIVSTAVALSQSKAPVRHSTRAGISELASEGGGRDDANKDHNTPTKDPGAALASVSPSVVPENTFANMVLMRGEGANTRLGGMLRRSSTLRSIEEHFQKPTAVGEGQYQGRAGTDPAEGEKENAEHDDEGPQEEGKGHESSELVAAAYMKVLHAALCEESFSYAVLAAKFAWGGVVSHVEELQPQQDELFQRKIVAVMVARQMTQTPVFVNRCCILNGSLHSHNQPRPAILVGPPQSGKSTCVDVVKRARIFDLDDPFKDPVPEASVKYVTPLAFFASQTDEGEMFDAPSVRTSIHYARWYMSAELRDEFMYPGRWLVLDCSAVEELDAWVLHEHDRKRRYSRAGMRNPSFLVETCSLASAPPSLLSTALIVPFGEQSVTWEIVFEGWKIGPGSLLESRTLKEIETLMHTHIPEIQKFIQKECR